MKITNSKMTPSTQWILSNMHETDSEVTIAGKIRNEHRSDATVEIHHEGEDNWYLFGGHLMSFALVNARTFEDAYEIYLEEFVPHDAPDNEEEIEWGSYDGNGGWYSEVTLSYIMPMNIDDYTFDFDIVAS